MQRFSNSALLTFLTVFLAFPAVAAPDRISGRIDSSRTRALQGRVHPLAMQGTDQGPVDSAMAMHYTVMTFKPSSKQQAELDRLLAEQQNPSSPNYKHWLTPEEYGNRFGLSIGDESKVAAWLTSQGLTIDRHARGRNWIAFSGTAGTLSKAFHTSIHSLVVKGEKHYANISDPVLPEALADIVQGFTGLHDFRLKPHSKVGSKLGPNYTTTAGSHYLSPADYATIYNLSPLYTAGYDGTGASIAIVGQSDITLSDLRAFKTQFGLPVNDPKQVQFDGVDPGYDSGFALEANLDLEWAGAIAPKASIYYVYGQSSFNAFAYSIDANIAPILSISYGGCEAYNADSGPILRAYAQQASAQGITMLASSGDTGAAGAVCDGGPYPYAAHGSDVEVPASIPEITGVGGTQFNEGTGTFWNAKTATNGSSALTYIPEKAWNETEEAYGIASGGGGASTLFSKPGWQQGIAVPADGKRDVPDISMAAGYLHDGYLVYFEGGLLVVGGTSAGTPSMAGVLALLTQYQIKAAILTKPGLGNINPQLYRLAAAAPSSFHDITTGDNRVPCQLGTQDCLSGSYGYSAGTGYDLATGLGSIDANAFVTQFNVAVSGAKVTLTIDNARPTINSTVTATATIAGTSGTPTGTVDFNISGLALGSVPLAVSGSTGSATLQFPVYLLGTGTFTLSATYSGDAAFSSAGATAAVRVSVAAGASNIVLSAPPAVYPGSPDPQGLNWNTTITLYEFGGAFPSLVTGFTIDGQSQSLSQYFPSLNIPAGGSVPVNIVFYNLAPPVTRVFAFTGIDSNGNRWSRQISVLYARAPLNSDFLVTSAPLTITRNDAAAPGCAYSTNLTITDYFGSPTAIAGFRVGSVDKSQSIAAVFGTTQVGSFGSVTGTVCLGNVSAPANETIAIVLVYVLYGFQQEHDVTVSLAGPPAIPARMAPSATSLNLTNAAASQTFTLNLSEKSQPWTLSLGPNNRTGSWLTASPMSGIGPATITVSANGAGFGAGAYLGQLVLQSPNATPQAITVPVLFTNGGNPANTAISSVLNAASFTPPLSPGSLAAISGVNLSTSTSPTELKDYALPNSLNGVFVTVNGFPAPLQYVSPTQINVQIPYEVGAGPAALSVNNNGSVAATLIDIAPAAPGIFADATGNLVPSAVIKYSTTASLYVTGIGDTGVITTGNAPFPGFSPLPQPLLPLTVTVAGTPVFVSSVGTQINAVGSTLVRFLVPTWVPGGLQPVVVWINGVPSKPVNIQLN